MEKEKNIMMMVKGEYLYGHKLRGKLYVDDKLDMKLNIYIIKNIMEKAMMKTVIQYMN